MRAYAYEGKMALARRGESGESVGKDRSGSQTLGNIRLSLPQRLSALPDKTKLLYTDMISSFPQYMPKIPPDASATPPPPSSGGGKKKILIVEDERPLSHALELKMTHEGYEVQTALSGAEGLRESLTGKYDLILLDLIMPEIDGFGVLQSLKDKGITAPVIVLSNLGQEEDKVRAKSLGAIDYFVKANTPILEIVKKVKSVL